MKKMTLLLAMAAMFSSNCAFAQTNSTATPNNNTTTSRPTSKPQPACPKKEFAWGIGLLGLAVVGVVAGVTASMASGSN